MSGSKFVYLKRAAALLELALVNYAMQKVVARGFVPMMTPDLVKESVLEKCGFQPRGTATQVCFEAVIMIWAVCKSSSACRSELLHCFSHFLTLAVTRSNYLAIVLQPALVCLHQCLSTNQDLMQCV